MTGAGRPKPGAGGGGYSGPGDVVGGAVYWVSCVRAYNATNADGTHSGCNLIRSSDSHTCDVLLKTDGNWGNTTNCSTGGDNGTAVATWCNATTCSVTEAYDQTGNGHNFTQGTSANRPTITFSCIGTKACVASNAAGQWVQAPSAVTYSPPFTHVGVAKRTALTGGTQSMLECDSGTVQIGWSSSANTMFIYNGIGLNVSATDSVFHAVSFLFNSNSSDLVIDGVFTNPAGSPGASGCASTQDEFGVSIGNTMDAFVAESGIWNSGLSSANQTALCQNQQAFYGSGNFGAVC